MPLAALDFGPAQRSGQQELGGASPIAMNVVVDKTGAVRRRPGVQAYAVAPSTAVDADGVALLHETADGSLFAVGNDPAIKHIYQIAGGASADITGAAPVLGSRRPTAAETEAMVVFAGGDAPVKVEFAVGVATLLGGSPPYGSHVVANGSRLLMNDVLTNLGRVTYSGQAAGSSVAGHETWSGITSGFFSAEARPDPIVALHENTNEVFPFGTTSMQYFAPDATDTYAPITTTENGCCAPYSIVKVDQAFAWLDHQRRFVISDGRSLKVVSDDIQQTLNDIVTVSDCYGYRVHIGPVECLVWTFPTDGRTFAFQVGAGWAQWSGYSAGNWTPFTVLSHCLGPTSGTNIVGTTAGRIGRLLNGVADDLGSTIVASVTTGFQSRETTAKKRCRAVRLLLKRGEAASAPGPVGYLRWRDDLANWSVSEPIYFGHAGSSDPVVTLRSLGVYRSRQWEFTFSGKVDYALVAAEEEFEVLSS